MELDEKDIRRFQFTIRDHSDYDFTEYSLTCLRRRLTRILLEYEMDLEQIMEAMQSDGQFLDGIVKKITVHTTELFRDPNMWKKLKQEVLPAYRNRTGVRIWHPGCSTGQEVYSMMMLLEEMEMLDQCQIYASDINQDVLEIAREGTYKYHFNQSYLENFQKVLFSEPEQQVSKLRKQWKKYFHIDETRDMIRMKDFLRNKPVYKKLDLVKDPNFFLVKFDLIVCRNVIIYFNDDLQNRVFRLFWDNLQEDGTLVLGVHESIMGPCSKRFLKKDSFYQKKPA
ncbi:MAG TPA: protein-glutamate O-methyltransferase CheR [Bacteroides sp.]|nr:protein-glutamate O-methyltransferase CheR [Bacteroides sp.]